MKQQLEIARSLWNQCFHDPEAYEEFYFETVYPDNRVYVDGEKGMLHLNPYLCHTGKEQKVLHYIVGVATDERYRRCGVMRGLLQKALADMRNNQEPFTYLMPADVQYYMPFGFVRVQEEERCTIDHAELSAAQVLPYSICPFEVVMRKKNAKQLAELFHTLDAAIHERYLVAPVHDEAYFRLLYKEKACQHGNIVFAFDEEQNVLGYYAYAMDEDYPRIEQAFWIGEDQTEWAVRQCFGREAGWWQSFPYMIRVVDVSSFLQVFSKQCRYLADGYDGLYITDSILKDNTGYYRSDAGWRKELQPSSEEVKNYRNISVEQLVEELFGREGHFHKKVWFAEVV